MKSNIGIIARTASKFLDPIKIFSLLVILFIQPMVTYASTISYTTSALGGGKWQYQYTVIAAQNESAIAEFSVFFDVSKYANLAVTASPGGWDSIVLQPDSTLPSDGIFDSLSLGADIGPGQSLDSFTVAFDFLGIGTPGAQTFNIIDPETFSTLRSGATIAAAGPLPTPSDVPEPNTLALAMIGVVTLLARRRRCKN